MNKFSKIVLVAGVAVAGFALASCDAPRLGMDTTTEPSVSRSEAQLMARDAADQARREVTGSAVTPPAVQPPATPPAPPVLGPAPAGSPPPQAQANGGGSYQQGGSGSRTSVRERAGYTANFEGSGQLREQPAGFIPLDGAPGFGYVRTPGGCRLVKPRGAPEQEAAVARAEMHSICGTSGARPQQFARGTPDDNGPNDSYGDSPRRY